MRRNRIELEMVGPTNRPDERELERLLDWVRSCVELGVAFAVTVGENGRGRADADEGER